MTLAQNDIERQVDLAVTPVSSGSKDRRRTSHVVIVAESESLAQDLSTEMAEDDSVVGRVVRGRLAAVLRQEPEALEGVDIVVFEVGSDLQADLAALGDLQKLRGAAHSIAVSRRALSPQADQALRDGGVQDVLTMQASDNAQEDPARTPADADEAEVFNLFAENEGAEEDLPVFSSRHAAAARDRVPPEATPVLPTTPATTPDMNIATTPDTTPSAALPAAAPLPDQRSAPLPATETTGLELPMLVPTSKPVAQEPVAHGGDITVVLRARGGAGATTVAVNLAVTQGGRSEPGQVALVDLDLQNGAVALALDLPDSPAATDFVKGEVDVDSAFLDRAMVRHSSGIDVLTAPDVFAPLTAIQPQMIADLLDALKARYAHVVLDMPQTVVDWIEPVLSRSARVLVVSDMSLPSIKRTRRLIDLIGEEHMTLPIQVVMNLEKKSVFPSATQKEAAHLIGRPLEHWIPVDPKAARRATDMGVPMSLGAKRSAPAKAIGGLVRSIFPSEPQE